MVRSVLMSGRDGNGMCVECLARSWQNHLEGCSYHADKVLADISQRAEADPNGTDPHSPGAKLDAGKVLAGVLEDFALALLAVAEVGTFGANKYTRGGWQSVPNGIERYNDAKWRHALKGRLEDIDPDSGLKHAAHEAWNALAKLELALRAERKE